MTIAPVERPAELATEELRPPRLPGWKAADVLRAAALVAAVYVGLRLLWFAHVLLFTAFLGVLFGLAVESPVDRLERGIGPIRIRRGLGAALVVAGALTLIAVFFTLTAPVLRRQSHELRARIPEAIDKFDGWVATHQGGVIGLVMGNGFEDDSATATPAAADSVASHPAATASSRLRARLLGQVQGARRFFMPVLSSTLEAGAGFLLIIFLSIYIAADPGLYHRGMLALVPHEGRKRAGEVLSEIASALRRWLVTQLIAMVVIGTVTTIILLVLRVRAAVPLGVLAGLFEFIPTIGPILSAVPAVAMGFVDSPEKALTVLVAYFGVQFLENHILIPLLMKQGVDLPPALTVLTQALMALVFGFPGLLVAVPLLAAAMVAVKMLYVEAVIGDPVTIPATAAAPPAPPANTA